MQKGGGFKNNRVQARAPNKAAKHADITDKALSNMFGVRDWARRHSAETFRA